MIERGDRVLVDLQRLLRKTRRRHLDDANKLEGSMMGPTHRDLEFDC
jgi:hypothetical protein